MYQKSLTILSLLILSFVADANIIRVDFTGKVTSIDSSTNFANYDWGYEVGDTLFQSVFIDTSLARDSYPSVTLGAYSPDGASFITSNITDFPEADRETEYLVLNPNYIGSGYQFQFQDGKYFSDEQNGISTSMGSVLWFSVYSLNNVAFIDNDSITQRFSIKDLTSFEQKEGSYSYFDAVYPTGTFGNPVEFREMNFEITSIDYNVLEASSPALLNLFLIFFLGIIIQSRLKK
jgi:hypothetical protein